MNHASVEPGRFASSSFSLTTFTAMAMVRGQGWDAGGGVAKMFTLHCIASVVWGDSHTVYLIMGNALLGYRHQSKLTTTLSSHPFTHAHALHMHKKVRYIIVLTCVIMKHSSEVYRVMCWIHDETCFTQFVFPTRRTA